MDNNHIVIKSDSKGNVSSPSRRGMESESHFLFSVNEDFKLEIIPLSDDS